MGGTKKFDPNSLPREGNRMMSYQQEMRGKALLWPEITAKGKRKEEKHSFKSASFFGAILITYGLVSISVFHGKK